MLRVPAARRSEEGSGRETRRRSVVAGRGAGDRPAGVPQRVSGRRPGPAQHWWGARTRHAHLAHPRGDPSCQRGLRLVMRSPCGSVSCDAGARLMPGVHTEGRRAGVGVGLSVLPAQFSASLKVL